MTNKVIAREFKRYAQLMEFHGQNTFKIKAANSSAEIIAKLPFEASSKSLEELSAVPGIGKSTAAKMDELVRKGVFIELSELEAQTSPGVLELLKIKGLGPKKIALIWKEMGIDSIPEIWYACKENKIAALKGFGAKTQADLQDLLEFTIENQGKHRFADIEALANSILKNVTEHFGGQAAFTGSYRRLDYLIEEIDVLVAAGSEAVYNWASKSAIFSELENKDDVLFCQHESGLRVVFHPCNPENFYARLVSTTGSEEHIATLKNRLNGEIPALESEAAIYEKAGLPWIEPEIREGLDEIERAASGSLPNLLSMGDFKGSIHNHSTWSDGAHSIEEMALYCRDELKLEYFGISDHSQSAFYANGLKIDRLLLQWQEIAALNQKLAPFRIFTGIESDILSNGALDYPDEILSQFDFVVASIHSQLNMDEKKATQRLIKAIENPYTTILGHPTGRKLLVRRGYPIDHQKIIDACAANGVIIEINANPNRLDIDWSWIPYCLEKGVMLSVNPDAHHTAELGYLQYGLHVARKGGLQASECLNCLDAGQVGDYFAQRKLRINR
jgi:DNA polymerase (family 10)